MSKLSIKKIDESFNKEILNIIQKSPISTPYLTLNFDRSPDFFALHKAGFDHTRYVGLFLDDQLTGFAGTCFYEGRVGDKEESIIYYTNLYVLPEGRKRGFFYRSSDTLMKDRYQNARLGISVIMKGNENARRLIGKQSEKYPLVFSNKICHSLVVKNILITLPKRESKTYDIQNATHEDVDQIVTLLESEYKERSFAPHIGKEKFLNNLKRRPNFNIENYFVARKDGEIIGVCGAWDPRELKQTRVLEYKGKFRWIRILYQLTAPLLRLPNLPKKGGCFKEITLIDYVSKNNNPGIMEAILRRIYNSYRNKGYNSMIFGSYEGDELIKATKTFHSTTIESYIVLGCETEKLLNSIKVHKPYINIAFL